MVAEQCIDFVLTVAPVGIRKFGKFCVIRTDRDPFLASGRLEASIVLNREVMRLILP